MADDKTKKRPENLSRISVSEKSETEYWTRKNLE